MFLFFISVCAFVSCVILIVFLKFSNDKQHQQQSKECLVDAVTFLRSVRSTKPFPVSSVYGWKVFCVCNDTRVWNRSLIIDNSGARIQVVACYVKVNAPVQVVTKCLKDVAHFVEWRPGFESATHSESESSKQYRGVSHDFINLVTANQKLSAYAVVVEQKNIERFWRRESNGCFWLLESCDTGMLFYILQPVEDLECCCLTVMSYSICPVTLQQSAVTVSSYAQSMRDYMFYRKMKVTPLLNFHIPQSVPNSVQSSVPDSIQPSVDDKPVGLSSVTDDLTDSYVISSTDDEGVDDSFHRKFAVLNPSEKSLVLEKSDYILHSRAKDQRLRSQSDTNTGDNKLDLVKQRSATLPKDLTSSRSDPYQQTEKNTSLSDIYQRGKVNGWKTNSLDSKQGFDDDVFFDSSTKYTNNVNTPGKTLPNSDNTHQSVICNNLPSKNGAQMNVPSASNDQIAQSKIGNDFLSPNNSLSNSHKYDRSSYKVSDKESSNDELEALGLSENQIAERIRPEKQVRESSPDDIHLITLANQCAANLLAEFLQVSNIDLKKPKSQQSATSGGWTFCGLENDVVILKKVQTEGSSVVSYMGKGLIHASPQTILETVKNPRTKFTYDETLKKVDVLNDITEKIKIVYFYHEVINMFKKSSYDFCVLLTERQDGDKYVVASTSVETGLPSPVGVQRAQMLPSGWVIEPVQKEKKTYSMATYIIQVDFGMPASNLDNTAIEELVSK